MSTCSDSVPFSVAGKTAIVTGAGSGESGQEPWETTKTDAGQGINLAFAELLLRRQCNVVIADLALRPEAQKLVDEHSLKEDGKPRAVFVRCDVVNWNDLNSMFDVADEEFGGADIVGLTFHLVRRCWQRWLKYPISRCVLAGAFSNHTGRISGNHPAQPNPKISFKANAAWATTRRWTSTSRIPSVRLSSPFHAG